MTYTAFDQSKPDPSTQAGTAELDSSRYNMQALRDALAATGIVQGFNYSQSGGTADKPTTAYYKRGAEWIRVGLTWGASGGGLDCVATMTFDYSSDSGGNWDHMADLSGYYILTLTYDSNGNVTATTWS